MHHKKELGGAESTGLIRLPSPGGICFGIRHKGWCGDEWAVQVLANVDLLG